MTTLANWFNKTVKNGFHKDFYGSFNTIVMDNQAFYSWKIYFLASMQRVKNARGGGVISDLWNRMRKRA